MVTAIIINQRGIGLLYRFQNVIARFTDVVTLPLLFFCLFLVATLVVSSTLLPVYLTMDKLGLPDARLPVEAYQDFSALIAPTGLRLLLFVPFITILLIRDSIAFPLRTERGFLFACLSSLPVFWVVVQFLDYLRMAAPISDVHVLAASSSTATSLLAAFFAPVQAITDLIPDAESDSPIVVAQGFVAVSMILVVLSSFVFLFSIFINILGQFRNRTVMAGKGSMRPGLIRILPLQLANLLSVQKWRLLQTLFLLVAASISGSIIVLAERVIGSYAIPLTKYILPMLLETKLFSTDQQSAIVSTLFGILPHLVMATIMFAVSGRVGLGGWHPFRVFLFFLFNIVLIWLIVQISSSIRNVTLLFYPVVVALIAVLPLIYHAYSLFRYTLLASYTDAQKQLLSSSLRFSLLLRPFALDALKLMSPFGFTKNLSTGQRGRVRLEEVIARSASLHGPLYAVGKPNELPKLGAMRHYFADDRWESYVDEAIAQSARILFIVDRSDKTIWETNQILKHEVVSRVVFVIPPKPGAAIAYFKANPKLINYLELDGDSLEQIDLQCVLIIVASKSGHYMIMGAGKTDLDYLLALDKAMNLV